jgi:hypothetical protein
MQSEVTPVSGEALQVPLPAVQADLAVKIKKLP